MKVYAKFEENEPVVSHTILFKLVGLKNIPGTPADVSTSAVAVSCWEGEACF